MHLSWRPWKTWGFLGPCHQSNLPRLSAWSVPPPFVPDTFSVPSFATPSRNRNWSMARYLHGRGVKEPRRPAGREAAVRRPRSGRRPGTRSIYVAFRFAELDHTAVEDAPGGRWSDDPDRRDPRALQPYPGDPLVDGQHPIEDGGANRDACRRAGPSLQ